MNLKCNVFKRVKTDEGMRYCPVVETSNGRIKADWVVVGDTEERHPEGAYYISWYEGTKVKRLSVGNEAVEAHAQKLRKQAELNAKAQGLKMPAAADSRSLSDAIATYLDEIRLTKKASTLISYTQALDYFAESCQKTIGEIGRRDLLEFAAFLRDEKELSARSVYNKFAAVVIFLKFQEVRNVVGKNDWPRYTEEEPDIYEPEELEKLFDVCDSEEGLWFEFFLMTGMRDREMEHVYWSDVNLKTKTARVSHKANLGWTPKAYKEREIPIPTKLADALHAIAPHTKNGNHDTLVFPTAGRNCLYRLKAAAKRAKLNQDDFWLHKFRATFATRCLQSGIDLRTVQLWLGHSDIESTMRYLKPARDQKVRDRMDEVF